MNHTTRLSPQRFFRTPRLPSHHNGIFPCLINITFPSLSSASLLPVSSNLHHPHHFLDFLSPEILPSVVPTARVAVGIIFPPVRTSSNFTIRLKLFPVKNSVTINYCDTLAILLCMLRCTWQACWRGCSVSSASLLSPAILHLKRAPKYISPDLTLSPTCL